MGLVSGILVAGLGGTSAGALNFRAVYSSVGNNVVVLSGCNRSVS